MLHGQNSYDVQMPFPIARVAYPFCLQISAIVTSSGFNPCLELGLVPH